ncbi:type IV-A pilus assembly ATPase PilB [Halomonas litopenaei]|uniref:Type IV-A pilus assembly ATPase PilB n=1 Tax=Halomonas litopenaei TaxID=2109328 RepID=A0ABX5IV52_9GAMM|nr:type IV-A pilus assembly ATPase PilB [Halomonas sp. SYSU XM8]PTL94442.1 type IV-A pilus assembly ATPase PilB [Halomonas litopenaei]
MSPTGAIGPIVGPTFREGAVPFDQGFGNGSPQGPNSGLAQRLVSQGLLSPPAALRAEREAQDSHSTLLRYLVEHELVSVGPATRAAAEEYDLPFVDLQQREPSELPPLSHFPEALLREHSVLPLSLDDHQLHVAVPYPSTLARLGELQFVTGKSLKPALAPLDQIRVLLDAYLGADRPDDGAIAVALGALGASGANSAGADERSGKMHPSRQSDLTSGQGVAFDTEKDADLDEELHAGLGSGLSSSLNDQADDAPVVKFVNTILRDAVRKRASDIHFEPFEESFRVRFRIDGLLHEVAQPPLNLRGRIASRLKVMARMDISERRLPQDGTIKVQLDDGEDIDFRVNSLPTVYGEKIVLRLLGSRSARLGIEQLGFSPDQRRLFETALASPQGMILVTGPTGSGKTVTLYTGIHQLNAVERNICTAEDPVEIKLSGINQVNVAPRIGLDFANALRAFLRQDPDVVMVGEVRDRETAEIAIKAAQTGHLVLSTLHTNSAADTLSRLSNMGIEAFNIASAVSLIVAQRLARRLCSHCRSPVTLPAEVLVQQGLTQAEADIAELYEAVGCRHCTQGYKGRVGLFEVVPVDQRMRRLILEGGSADDFDALARAQGYPNLRRSGLDRVLEGVTSLAEVCRITAV